MATLIHAALKQATRTVTVFIAKSVCHQIGILSIMLSVSLAATATWIERHAVAVLLLIVLALVASLIPRAHAKPFWHDEVYTVLESQFPSLKTLWAAELDGVDLSPPLYTALIRVVHAVSGVGRVSTRVPSILAFVGSCVLLFTIVRLRSNAVLGLASALLLQFTAAYRYAIEARGYEITVFAFLLAIYAWMKAERRQN